jgi:hypothetical protein
MRKLITTALCVTALTALGACTTDTGTAGHHGTSGSGKSGSAKAGKSGKAKSGPSYTVAQANAIKSAQTYLSMGSGFSRTGLIQQLSSKAGDGFKLPDATFAVDHVSVDWNKQAVMAAKTYLQMSGFSRSGLIQQLTSKAGDQFTVAQATYAANHVGL